MAFVKVVKNKAYFKRFQVKYRRRRECKTDYYARKRLIIQDKNKYGTPKYRFVVRITNRDIVCQILSAELNHDVCHVAAYSHELKRYGVQFGLTNYAAAYATGLLLARRVNEKFKLPYEGVTEADGEHFLVEKEGEKAPFKAYLDIGLKRTTTGARIFGALKGAVDGGLEIPHNDRRFPGSKADDKEKYVADAEVHRKYIFGGHVASYINDLDDEERKKRFGRLEEAGISGDDLEGIYTSAHAAIRKEPFKKRDPTEKGYFLKRETPKAANATYPKKQWKQQKVSASQRHNRIVQIMTTKKVAPTLVNRA